MTNLKKYHAKLPSRLSLNLSNFLFGNANIQEEELELVISINQFNLNIKELSSYLEFIYRVDGLLSDLGLYSYSHYPKAQIQIDEIRFGSWEIVLQKALGSIDAERVLIIWLVLKYLPQLISNYIDIGIKTMTFLNQREDYLEKKQNRKFRKEIRNLINSDDELGALEKKTKEKMINLLNDLYSKNIKNLIPSSRFANNSIKEIKVSAKKKSK